VLERLRTAPLSPADRELRRLQAELRADPTNAPLAARVASRLVAKARGESDPRWLGQALAALAPWSASHTAPVEVLVLRATVRQGLHDFESALSDLDAALRLDPRHAQAWLTQASIHTVRGEFDEARRACWPLLRLTDELTFTAATASIASLTGQARPSAEQLEAALARQTSAPVPVRLWALTLLAEISARLGDLVEADSAFRQALALDDRDPYLLGAYADFLLDAHRPEPVITMLASHARLDALLLRQAEARQKQGNTAETARLVAALRARFDIARQRGDRVHLREEARFQLRLLHQPAAALALAKENWLVQKEPADARLLLECARAAGDDATVRLVRAWARATRLEDVTLAVDL
jgi:Tfp pilus assembly protein PilF